MEEKELSYEDFSEEMQRLCDKYSLDEFDYNSLEDFLEEAEKLGYTFDYYLDAVPFNFRII
jgi:hypothetical protein